MVSSNQQFFSSKVFNRRFFLLLRSDSCCSSDGYASCCFLFRCDCVALFYLWEAHTCRHIVEFPIHTPNKYLEKSRPKLSKTSYLGTRTTTMCIHVHTMYIYTYHTLPLFCYYFTGLIVYQVYRVSTVLKRTETLNQTAFLTWEIMRSPITSIQKLSDLFSVFS